MKVVLDTQVGRVLVGVQRDGKVDPVMRSVPGVLGDALAIVPAMVDEAEARWKDAPKNPAYVAPKEEAKPADKPASTTAAKRPFKVVKAPRKGHVEPPAPESPPTTPEASAAPQDAQPEATESLPEVSTAGSEQQPIPPVATTGNTSEVIEQPVVSEPEAKAEPLAALEETANIPEIIPAEAETGGGPALVGDLTPLAKPKRKYEHQGNFEYMVLAGGGSGPFADVTTALKEGLGLDSPKHNRWEKLSAKLQKLIVRRVKGAISELPEEGTPEPSLRVGSELLPGAVVEETEDHASVITIKVDHAKLSEYIACAWHSGHIEATLPMQRGDLFCQSCKKWYRNA